MNTSLWQKPFLVQVLALMLVIILVHGTYVTVIRPIAAQLQQKQEAQTAEGEVAPPVRSLYVLIKDYEQEVCFMMLLWAVIIMGYKATLLQQDARLLNQKLIQIEEGMSILPADAKDFSRSLQALPEAVRTLLFPRLLLTALQRFTVSKDSRDAAESVHLICEQTADQLESEMSMLRYIAWAIPSVGFIGTVRGIGAALGEAHKAVEGDIAGVTSNLGIAFNSTLIALVLSIILMFLMHQLQLMQERLIINARSSADQQLLRHLKTT